MTRVRILLRAAAILIAGAVLNGQPAASSLHGTITDPSGARVPEAMVQLKGPGGEQRAYSDAMGQYSFQSLSPGKYQVRVIAKGFSVSQYRDYDISKPAILDVQLTIEATSQVMNVEDEANRVTSDPAQNGGALVIGEKELQTLSDDPDELQQQLQAMAGPAAGPSGGQIYIDGFTGGNMPPKASIREVRINSNPFSPEYDRPGFGRIEIFTRPGTDKIRGQAFFQFNNEQLNSRSPLLEQSTRPPYDQKFYGLNLSGPIVKQKASFGFDFERRNTNENALILATTLDAGLNPVQINQAVVTPQVRTTFVPRFDYSINSKNTLTLRYQKTHSESDKMGVGDYRLESRAFDQSSSEHAVQLTETAVLSATAINETRFQFMRSSSLANGDNSIPALTVQGAFENGGAQIGASGSTSNRYELTNSTTLTRGAHTLKWGGRARQVLLDDTSVNNFGGTYTFFGGTGPLLDAANQPIPGALVDLTALERYRRTLLFQQLGYSAQLIRALGGGASQLSLAAGVPTTPVRRFDVGVFFNDDWRLRPNLTVSYGLRYEVQTNLNDFSNVSPRVGIAWGVDGGSGRSAKTVVRLGFGTFYDRLSESSTLQAERYNGVTQQSYLILNPDTYPIIPTPGTLEAFKQPQQLQILDSSLLAARTYQWSAGVDRQVNRYVKISANYIGSRGVHLNRSRNINTPIDGVYPFGDKLSRLLTESTGFNRTNMLMISPNVSYKKLFLFGFYGLSYGRSDAEGQPADPYNLRAEWGPSGFGDIRHRMMLGTNIPMPWKINLSPFLAASSGSPYNITTGRDLLSSGFTTARPALLAISAAQCAGGNLVYEAGFGCFDLNPAAGTAVIMRNYGRGPATFSMNLRVARTWSFGRRGESGPADAGMRGGPPAGGGPGGGGPPPGGGPGGGGPPPGGGPGGGPGGPGGMFSSSSGRKYNVTLSAMALNILNHPNWASPSGDLSSPYFGEYRSLAGMGPMGSSSTYNRKIDIQLRFQF